MAFLFRPEYMKQRPAWFHTRILVGPGDFLTPRFAAEYRITHVINCAFDENSPAWFRRQYPDRYAVLNAVDALDQNILVWYPTFEETLRRFIREANGTIYVHCQAGMNRSATLALIYVCKNLAFEPDIVIASTKNQRPCMFRNPTFMTQAKEFINGCLSRTQDPRTVSDDGYRRDVGLDTSGNDQ